MDRSQLLKRLGETWNALGESYAALSEAGMLEPGVAGAWSIKDIIAHVSALLKTKSALLLNHSSMRL